MNEEPSGIEDRSMCSHGLGDGAAEISDQFSGFISDQVEENQLDEDVSICSNEEDLEMEIEMEGISPVANSKKADILFTPTDSISVERFCQSS